MNLGNVKIRNRVPSYSQNQQRNKANSFEICEQVQKLKSETSVTSLSKILLHLIELCYNNKANQFFLCNNLGLPFCQGPVALTCIPNTFRNKGNQLLTLFQYLNKIKQSYICWMIFMDQELGVLNLKLFTHYQLSDAQDRFQDENIMVGIYVGEKYFPKGRAMSTKQVGHKLEGLSCKTTKQSLKKKVIKQKSNKSLKSISMKQKKHRHELSMKIQTGWLVGQKQSSKTGKLEERNKNYVKTGLMVINKTLQIKDNKKNKIKELSNSFQYFG